jgi:hypothetical protein
VNFPFYQNAPKELVTECNLCGSARLRPMNTVDRYGLDAPTVSAWTAG